MQKYPPHDTTLIVTLQKTNNEELPYKVSYTIDPYRKTVCGIKDKFMHRRQGNWLKVFTVAMAFSELHELVVLMA